MKDSKIKSIKNIDTTQNNKTINTIKSIKSIKTIVILILIACMVVFSFSSCGGGDGSTGSTDGNSSDLAGSSNAGASEQSDKPAGTVISEDENTLTVVDQAGREVTVSKNNESIALCYRVVIRFLLSLDQGDKIKGIGKSEEFLEVLQPSLADCEDVGKGVADLEALAELKPDLFIHKASDLDTLEAVEKIGIPSVGIEVETPEEMVTALELLGKVCGEEDKAGKLIDYYEGQISDAEELAAAIPEKDRHTAIVMGTSIGKVADGSMLQGRMLQIAGGINCASDLKATELWPMAGVEQIFQWDPEYIFITNSESAAYSAEDILSDPAWSEMKAVKSGHVYTMPAAMDSWEFPGVVSTLGIDYMMHIMYPDLIDEKTLEKNVDDLYELSYGRTFTRDELGW